MTRERVAARFFAGVLGASAALPWLVAGALAQDAPAGADARAAALFTDNCAACHKAGGPGPDGALPPLAGNTAVTAAEPFHVIAVTLQGLPADGRFKAMPSFAGRLSDAQIADLTNYVRTSWGNKAAPNATTQMVETWRETTRVPDYGTQAASSFGCAEVGGAPGSAGPDPRAVAAIDSALQGGDLDVDAMVDSYKAAAPEASPAQVVDALMAAYCPVVAAGGGEDYQKIAKLRRFTLQAVAYASEAASPTPFPPVSVVWAVQAGPSLVARAPKSLAGPLVCPVEAGKLVPQALATDAATLVGKPSVPATGTAGADWADALVKQDPKARLADVANALISAYCEVVASAPGLEEAQQHGYVESFGQQVIQTLQLQP